MIALSHILQLLASVKEGNLSKFQNTVGAYETRRNLHTKVSQYKTM